MPGPYIHMSAARHAAERLSRKYSPARSERIDPRWTGFDPTRLARIAAAHPNFVNLGAIGPDLFFFLPDFRDQHGVSISSVLVEVLDFLERIYAAVDPYVSKWEHYLGPISEDTAEEMSRLTGGLSETVGDISGELSSILITLLEDFFVQQNDWWSFFSLGLNVGFDEQAYFWSDMLHYRDTGIFARALWRNADAFRDADGQDSDAARAYALGYISHVATDVTGHAFVNVISGGPFRLHWQRHHLVENHADAFWYLSDPEGPRATAGYAQLTESALYFDIAFADGTGDPVPRPSFPAGNTLRDNWIRKRRLDIDSEIGEPVADLLLKTIEEVFYQGEPHPKILQGTNGRPTADMIGEAYRLIFRYLKLATVDGFSHEPPPPPEVFPNLDFPTMTDPADDPPGEDDGGSFWDDLLDFLLSIIAILAYLAEVAAYLATLPWAVLADLVTYPLRLGLYYALEMPLFLMLKHFRAVLVLTGYMLPMSDEIVPSLAQIGSMDRGSFDQLLGEMGDPFGGMDAGGGGDREVVFRDPRYPFAHPDDEFRHPWDYPDPAVPTELPPTTGGPYARGSGPPVLFQDLDSDSGIRDRLESAVTPSEADAVGPDLRPARHLGDAVGFSKYLMWLSTRSDPQEDGSRVPVVDWNLDADRGYAYHCWDWNRHPASEEFPPQPDPEGNTFGQPCTWPSQSDDSLDPAAPASWNPAIPLRIHWAGPGLEDPGCGRFPLIAAEAAAARRAARGRRAPPPKRPRKTGRTGKGKIR